MSIVYHLTIAGTPTSKLRHRRGKHGQYYNPVAGKEKLVRRNISEQLPIDFQTITNPVTIDIVFFFKPSDSRMKNKKFRSAIDRGDKIPHNIKPDKDNLEKFVLDCLNKFVISDDSIVYAGSCEKYFSKSAYTEITIITKEGESYEPVKKAVKVEHIKKSNDKRARTNRRYKQNLSTHYNKLVLSLHEKRRSFAGTTTR